MKKLYWHRHNLPRVIMVLYCTFVLASLYAVERFQQTKPQPYFNEKYQAAEIAYQAINAVTALRKLTGLAISSSTDPAGTGLIGEQITAITTDEGQLSVKQSLINPNLAALFVLWLEKIHVHKGDTVAVAMTGSFPGANIAALAAIKALGLKPLIIISAGASQYGANVPGFTWVDMYHALQQQNIFPYQPLGVSLGGVHDDQHDMAEEGRLILRNTILQNGYPYLEVKSTTDSIDQRVTLYQQGTTAPIAAYINVGGGMASIGLKRLTHSHQHGIKPKNVPFGLVTSMPVSLADTDSVAVRFLKHGVPVINAHDIPDSVLDQYDFPHSPHHLPTPGKGGIFYHAEYNTWLAVGVFALDVLVFIGIAWLSKRYMLRYKRY